MILPAIKCNHEIGGKTKKMKTMAYFDHTVKTRKNKQMHRQTNEQAAKKQTDRSVEHRRIQNAGNADYTI